MLPLASKLRAASIVIFLLHGLAGLCLAGDMLNTSQSIASRQTLISSGGTFAFGFFCPGQSEKTYLGIWYNRIPNRTVIWVANRENPVLGSQGVMKISSEGNIIVLEGNGTTVWSTNRTSANNPVLQLLDSGNLVLKEADEDDPDKLLWQSFDYPSDCLLPAMKLGWNLRTGRETQLSSWRSTNDPAPGRYSFRIERRRVPEVYIYDRSFPIYRSGPWNGLRFSGVPGMGPGYVVTYSFVSDDHEISYYFGVANSSLLTRLVLSHTGLLERFAWVSQSQTWSRFWSSREDQCDDYADCGPNGVCDSNKSPISRCRCLDGFSPKSPQAWYLRDSSDGCVRKMPLSCQVEHGFLKLQGIKLPDTSNSSIDRNMDLRECRRVCMSECGCTGYASADIRGRGSGCITWKGDLVDLRQYDNEGQDFYLRVPASELGITSSRKKSAIIASSTVVPAVFVLVVGGSCLWKRKSVSKKPVAGSKERTQNLLQFDPVASTSLAFDKSGESRADELPLLDILTVIAATNDFSDENKLGEGGFGAVYKGSFLSNQEIAVKRLCKLSGQGLEEFMNEVTLIAKLQHRNLVRLLGCCIHGDERMLIYEYMPNKSLDLFVFDQKNKVLLNWQQRFAIVMGIARGLQYLHHDSRLRIIHRDLKAGNILLDHNMTPKISDFGMAKMFGGDQTEGSTKRVVGTYGYMAPEYAMDGLFSVKSDVFSFGVLVLEILSGMKNRGFYQTDLHDNLLSMVWELWSEGSALELVDPSIDISPHASEVLRCVHVALLCVQEHTDDRPTISEVILMLGSEGYPLQQPKQPGFVTGRSHNETDSSSSRHDLHSVNQLSISKIVAR